MPNLNLVGAVPVELDHAYSITCEEVGVDHDIPSEFHAGPFGSTGISQGQGPVNISLTFGVPATGPEFPVSSLKVGQHTISITLSPGNKKLATGCKMTGESYKNNPKSGITTITLKFMGTDFLDG